MRSTSWRHVHVCVGAAALFLSLTSGVCAQGVRAQDAPPAAAPSDLQKLTELIGNLQTQLQNVTAELKEVRANQMVERSEIGELQRQLSTSNAKLALLTTPNADAKIATGESSSATDYERGPANPPSVQEELDLAAAKLQEQSQTKVESGSKYRLRFSGIVLFNLFGGTGHSDNVDFPQFILPPDGLNANHDFGGTLRQSQIRVQSFGPDIAGAHTSADLKFDFAGGFPSSPNGVQLGVARLRTGTIRFDWTDTSVIAGQDFLFFAPLVPTSLASLATPALSYSGNLWGWTPQVRVEHTLHLREGSTVLLQGGIMDSLSGDVPTSQDEHSPTWGEQSGQPAYAGRVSWSRPLEGQNLTIGAGGYFGPQSWGFGRRINGWAVTSDLLVPLNHKFEVSAEFYRGKAIGGFGAGLGQTALWNGSFVNPATTVRGLDSLGGWLQLKFKPTTKLQVNGALGIDSPFASELRNFGGNPYYDNSILSRNLTPLVNLIYQPRSDVLFSIEYRRLNTTQLDQGIRAGNQTSLNVGYLF